MGDALATVVHGAWGAFWIGFGVYQLFVGLGRPPSTTTASPAAIGFWFVGLGAITRTGALAALAESLVLCMLLAIGLSGDVDVVRTIAACFLLASAVLARYACSAMVLEAAHHRVVLPIGPRPPGPRQCRCARRSSSITANRESRPGSDPGEEVTTE
ncbi:hypothetical protein [Amycolatopsis rubida]|uniref:Uncharacterized protein n=1 Tax=Amycolatopsis rubida TaxID=112413 RepID=A0A1I6B4D8_9PSEU|nr:hypothetical protein [Amycolatopsis rubida]SFQ75810.1 hypothetical protein SAMN05421854_12340 [Amycolatopsis rubida]